MINTKSIQNLKIIQKISVYYKYLTELTQKYNEFINETIIISPILCRLAGARTDRSDLCGRQRYSKFSICIIAVYVHRINNILLAPIS